MSDIDKRLREAFDKVAVCHCGNGIADGCCDNHAPSWNPCPDSQLLHDAQSRIAALEATERELREAVTLLAELIECYERQDKLRADDNASCGDLFLADKNQDHAWNNVHLNPIAAAAVREAGR